MMSHDSNDTLFPWYGHTSFEISMRQENPSLDEIITIMQRMRKKIYKMNIQWNSYDVPRFQRHPVHLVWAHQLRDLGETINPILAEILK